MDNKQLIKELNMILTFEHGHLGMYENYDTYQDKDIRRTFRRFMELEMEHINRIQSVIRNLGEKPSLIIEGGDILGKLFGISMQVTGEREILKVFDFIEQKSHQGYSNFISKLEQKNDNNMYQFITEITAVNKLEAQLQHLWLKDKLNQI